MGRSSLGPGHDPEAVALFTDFGSKARTTARVSPS
jgi:hypothetical protein